MYEKNPKIAIVDYGLGNLFSVKQACLHVGLNVEITSSKQNILEADAVILPGVGAIGDAMATLHRLDLASVLCEIAASPKPLVGICLGVQLLMSESYEFGLHKGLGIIEGTVVRLNNPKEDDRRLKVPHIAWNRIRKFVPPGNTTRDPWAGTLLDGTPNGEHMYFVHSYVVQPQDSNAILSTSCYGQIEFCSSVRLRNVFACQFHPERSGWAGLRMYENIKTMIENAKNQGG